MSGANSLRLAVGVLLASSAFSVGAEEHQGHREGGEARGHMEVHSEAHQGPQGYQRVAEPSGWNHRPDHVDRGFYQHNYRASRAFHVGPYHPPAHWAYRAWRYGEVLPRPLWDARYILADYWLFALEVPPVGYEWVRVGPDALLISTVDGTILQVEYGVFA